MRRLILPAALLLVCSIGGFFAACKEKKPQAVEPAAEAVTPPDTACYGVLGESGMSTFCLITDAHDTLNVTRVSEDGTYGAVYGDENEGDRFTVTLRDSGEALGVAINLSQLDTYGLQYATRNGQLVVGADTVRIRQLCIDSLTLILPAGDVRLYLPKR